MKYHYKYHDLNQSVGSGVRISMFVLSVVDRGFQPQSGQTKGY